MLLMKLHSCADFREGAPLEPLVVCKSNSYFTPRRICFSVWGAWCDRRRSHSLVAWLGGGRGPPSEGTRYHFSTCPVFGTCGTWPCTSETRDRSLHSLNLRFTINDLRFKVGTFPSHPACILGMNIFPRNLPKENVRETSRNYN